MSSYLSNLLTTTSTRYASLRNLLPTGEADGDTPDDTHICRVLRAYYSEKGRPFPSWLPPDPKASQPAQIIQTNYGSPVGAGYGNLANAGGGRQLGTLWDNNAGSGRAQAPATQSLRPGRTALRGAGGVQRGQQQQEEYVAARPLPSQREGTYQTSNILKPVSSAGSAQDRLKQRLWGGVKSNNSSQNSLNQGQEVGQQPQRGAYGRQESYDSSRSSDRPFVSANSPWSSEEREFGGGGGQYDQGLDPGRRGLPSGPRGYR
jgi:hypothetical protein